MWPGIRRSAPGQLSPVTTSLQEMYGLVSKKGDQGDKVSFIIWSNNLSIPSSIYKEIRNALQQALHKNSTLKSQLLKLSLRRFMDTHFVHKVSKMFQVLTWLKRWWLRREGGHVLVFSHVAWFLASRKSFASLVNRVAGFFIQGV